MQILFKARYFLLLLTVIACILAFPYVKFATKVDNSLHIWFLKNDPSLVEFKTFQTSFGNDEVIILVVSDKTGLLTPGYFKAFKALSEALETGPDIKQVIGPGNAKIIEKDALGVFSKPLLVAGVSADQVKNDLKKFPFLRKQLYSADFTTARFIIIPENQSDFENKRGEILAEIKRTVHQYIPEDKSFFGGVGIIYAGLNSLSEHDFGLFLFAGYLIMFVVLLCIHRSFLILLYALGTVGLATSLTLGIYGACGYRLNLMTVMLPMIFILLGIMDVMHIINEYGRLSDSENSPKEKALKALSSVFKPCLFTALTTMAGFLASVTSPMPILKTFGIFAALGIFFCLVFTYLLGVLILPFAKPHTYTTILTGKKVISLCNFVTNNRKRFTYISSIVITISLVGILFLKSDTYTLGYFPKNDRVVTDNNIIQKQWGAYMPLEITVKPHPGFRLNSPEVVKACIAFTDSLKQIKGIGNVAGFHSFYEAFLQVQYKEKAFRMLNSQGTLKLADKNFALYYQELRSQLVSADNQTGRITISGNMLSANELSLKMASIKRISDKTIGAFADVKPAGYQPMYANIVNYVTSSQISSFLLSVGFIFLLIWIYLKNFKLTIIAIIPNITPVVMMLGLMGWLNISLDTATASIASIVLGIAIDDTIHYIYHYKNLKDSGIAAQEARLLTTAHVTPAIILTGLLLVCGYSFMLFASLKTVQFFGLLTAIAIISGVLCELILFPLLLQKFDED
ncbi:MAG: hypothetical protein JWQ25_2425 [Daejeonella sp.]|nr:hypothetical protein [Daejeonella sp.]